MTYKELFQSVNNGTFGNPFQYAAICERRFEQQTAETGYQRISTFSHDLSIAEWMEARGHKGQIAGTYRDVLKEWHGNYKMFAEFILALNYKAWDWYTINDDFSRLYSEFYDMARERYFARFNENEEAIDYYYNVVD